MTLVCIWERTVTVVCIWDHTVTVVCIWERTVTVVCIWERTVTLVCIWERTVTLVCIWERTVTLVCIWELTVTCVYLRAHCDSCMYLGAHCDCCCVIQHSLAFFRTQTVFTGLSELDVHINSTRKGCVIALGSYSPACYWRIRGSFLVLCMSYLWWTVTLGTGFSPHTSISPSQCHSINAPSPSSSTCYCHQKDKMTKPWNRPKQVMIFRDRGTLGRTVLNTFCPA